MQNDLSFLGTGWSFPISFTQGGREVEMVSGPEDIHQSLQVLFATQLGERVMQDEFGCDLNGFLFEEIDQGLINSLTGMISDAILYHEPRITMDRLEITASVSEPGLLLISIDYTIRSTNSRYNMVYPFYLNEATTPGM
ncbi:MAG TPA: GPW/gp25 family protein [Sedimentisphaerales bacterium]|nr:GPW/gp25 family protein [Sedimentisphaerales bacterium]